MTAVLTGSGLKPHRWRFILGSGPTIVRFQLPGTIRPGRYTVVWTVLAGTRKARASTRVTLSPRSS